MSRKKKKANPTNEPFVRDMPPEGLYRSQVRLGDFIRTEIELDTTYGNGEKPIEKGQVIYVHPAHSLYVLEFPNGIRQTEYFRHKPSLYITDQKYKATGAQHRKFNI